MILKYKVLFLIIVCSLSVFNNCKPLKIVTYQKSWLSTTTRYPYYVHPSRLLNHIKNFGGTKMYVTINRMELKNKLKKAVLIKKEPFYDIVFLSIIHKDTLLINEHGIAYLLKYKSNQARRFSIDTLLGKFFELKSSKFNPDFTEGELQPFSFYRKYQIYSDLNIIYKIPNRKFCDYMKISNYKARKMLNGLHIDVFKKNQDSIYIGLLQPTNRELAILEYFLTKLVSKKIKLEIDLFYYDYHYDNHNAFEKYFSYEKEVFSSIEEYYIRRDHWYKLIDSNITQFKSNVENKNYKNKNVRCVPIGIWY